MLIHCPSKRCNTTREHRLRLEDMAVICMDCGDANNMITDYMKSAMKSNGDIYRSVKSKKAFMFKCLKCGIDRSVKIVDEQALCDVCLHPFNLTTAMLEAVKTSSHNDSSDETKKEMNKGVIKRKAP